MPNFSDIFPHTHGYLGGLAAGAPAPALCLPLFAAMLNRAEYAPAQMVTFIQSILYIFTNTTTTNTTINVPPVLDEVKGPRA